MTTRLFQAIGRVSNSGSRPPLQDKLTVYDDNDLWEDQMKVYLEAVDEGAPPTNTLGRLDNEAYTVARAANLTALLTPATNFDLLRRLFSRCLRHWAVTEPRHRDRQLNGSGALLSTLLLGVALYNPQLLGEALHSLLDAGTRGNNVVARPCLPHSRVFM
ncbi:unnamed protein product [Schistocephalus solidus]|uniref:Rho-GAP domain-containing protein n=1 Tax=Schistocephalus solidus TaxID=70667 RepID=A0A183TEX5_SCHSO|nr:unnamed protein product [Schistocephalus solidus]